MVLSAVESGPLGYDSSFPFAHLSTELVESIRSRLARKVINPQGLFSAENPSLMFINFLRILAVPL